MMNKFFSIIFAILIVVILLSESKAETFEFLTYAPPSDWANQVYAGKTVYQRKSGIGAIVFYASYPTKRSASTEFTEIWQTQLGKNLPGAPPKPQIEQEDNIEVAIGTQIVNTNGTMTTVLLAAFVGRGRALGVISMSAGDDVLKEITAFFDSIKILPESSVSRSNSNSTSTGGIQVEFETPPGFTQKQDGQMIQLIPATFNEKTPCAYWISPPRPSKGSLETDARAAVMALPIQGKINEDYINAMRGIAPDGWKYFLFGADFRNSLGTSIAYGMALAVPAGTGQVNIILGIGNGATNCYVLDPSFIRLFHSLKPQGLNSDGGQEFTKELLGFWRDTRSGTSSANLGLVQYKFLPNGRYEAGRGTSTTIGNLETTTSIATDGSYKLSGNQLTVTGDGRRNISTYRIRIYEDYFRGKWWRKMGLLSKDQKIEMEYDRIED